MNYIIITTINNPTKAILEFAKLNKYEIIIVADRKTPSDWNTNYSNIEFLSLAKQESMLSELKSSLPYNHYSRKMLGYIQAIKHGAISIIDTDDDNFPEEFFEFPAWIGTFNTVEKDSGWINIYKYFTTEQIWPRGLPLKLIRDDKTFEFSDQPHEIGIWQSLANGDSDVDAIYRLTSDKHIQFERKEPIVLSDRSYSPFNSQSTHFSKKTFPLLYLPSTVTFRFTDILRSVVAQPILHAMNLKLGFISPIFFQERNEHDYIKDFESEIPMYLTIDDALKIVVDSVEPHNSVELNLMRAYKALADAGIVKIDELDRLDSWISDLNSITNPNNS